VVGRNLFGPIQDYIPDVFDRLRHGCAFRCAVCTNDYGAAPRGRNAAPGVCVIIIGAKDR
jgi:hypothetical protein